MDCAAALPYFDGQPQCSDRLRYTGRLLSLTNGYRIVPIIEPFSTTALKKAGIANTCRSPSKSVVKGIVSECSIDAVKLREKLADVLLDVSAQVAAKDENFRKDIKQSALSVNSDRRIHVTSRGGAITGVLLDDFGAFLDYKFREFDYYIGVYDAIVVLTDNLCTQNFPGKNQTSEINFCRDRLSEQIYHAVGVPGDSKGQYLFALAAQHEFGKQGGLRYAYEPMPPADRDIRIIYQGLNKPAHGSPRGADGTGELVSDEIVFFEHLKRQGFEPTPSTDGGASLLTQIMEEPEYWLHELAKRATDRLMHLEKQAEKVYQAREPDPEKQEKAHTALMGAGSLVLRTATYKYPTFSFSPSTAPDTWILRNIIPYEAAFDFAEGDFLFFWQPTWRLKRLNAGLRFGLGFTGGITNSNADKTRENFGTLGLDLTRNESTAIFSGWGIMPAAYHTWQKPEIVDQTTFGFDIHACLFKNRIRISLGTRDVLSNANDTVFLTLGVADLPGLIYWMSR